MADQEDTAMPDFHCLLYAEWYNSLTLVLYAMQGSGALRSDRLPTAAVKRTMAQGADTVMPRV